MLEAKKPSHKRSDFSRWRSGGPNDPPIDVSAETKDAPGTVSTPYGDILFLNVFGSYREMGDQMGTRMGDDIRSGPVPFFATYLEHVLQNSPVGKVSEILRWATHKWITGRLEKNLPPDFYEAVRAMSAASGLSTETFLKAYLMPEGFLWLVGKFHQLTGSGRAHGLGAPPVCGCTSAILSREDGPSPLHGRNFDYFGINYWDTSTTVGFYHPDDGMDYVGVGAAGIFGGGITGMNSAGLTLTVHQHFVDSFDLDGIPVGYAGDQVLRRAHSIEEAVSILRTYPPVAGWTYVMTEGDTGRSAIYEVAPGRENLHTFEAGESTGYANVYWGENLEHAEVDYYPEYRRSNHARQKRVTRCVASTASGDAPAQPVDVARILGDFTDPETGRRRLFGRSISSVHTVASVVFEPAERRVWVAAGRSPTAQNWYIPFKLARGGADGAPDASVVPFIPERGWHQTPHGQAFELYRKAAYRWWEGETSSRLLILIEHALALYPQEPNLHVLAGLLALRVARGKRAEGAFRRALEQITDAPRRAEVGLFLGWSLDLQGQRGAAKHMYKRIMRDDQAEPQTHSRARQYRWLKFGASQAESLAIDFVYAGVP
ncbi:MAG: C45 family autoproteolytic acyltransferase/hydrolase [Myxococcota bacterium]